MRGDAQRAHTRRSVLLFLLFALLIMVPLAGAALNLVRTVTPSIAQDHVVRIPQTAWHAVNGDGDIVFWAFQQEQAHVGIAKTNGAVDQKLICFIGGDITDCRFTAAMWTTGGNLSVVTQGGTDAFVMLVYDPDNFTTADPIASCAFSEALPGSVNEWELFGNTPLWRYPRDGTTDGFVVKRDGGYRSMAMPAAGEHQGTCTNLWNANEDVADLHVSVANSDFWWGSSSNNQATMERRTTSDGSLAEQRTLTTRPRMVPAWGTNGQVLDAVHVVACNEVDPGTCTGSNGHSQLKKYFWSSGAPTLNVTVSQNGTYDRHDVATDNVQDRVFSFITDGVAQTGFGRVINGNTAETMTGTCVVDLQANIRLSHPHFQGTNMWSVKQGQQALKLCETTEGESGGGATGGAGGVIPPGDPGGGEGGNGGTPPPGQTPTSSGIIAFMVTAYEDFFAVSAETAGFLLGATILGAMMIVGAKRGLMPFAALTVLGSGITLTIGLLPTWVVLVSALFGLAAAGRRVG